MLRFYNLSTIDYFYFEVIFGIFCLYVDMYIFMLNNFEVCGFCVYYNIFFYVV